MYDKLLVFSQNKQFEMQFLQMVHIFGAETKCIAKFDIFSYCA